MMKSLERCLGKCLRTFEGGGCTGLPSVSYQVHTEVRLRDGQAGGVPAPARATPRRPPLASASPLPQPAPKRRCFQRIAISFQRAGP